MESDNAPVLVAGGGLVGLAAACFLARRGVRCEVVEKRPRLSEQPRSRGINPRTMELLAELGLAERVRRAPSAVALRSNTGVIAMESLSGKEFGSLADTHQIDVTADFGELTGQKWCLCHQAELEPLLLERARELGVRVRFGVEVAGVRQDAGGVEAELRGLHSGEGRTVRARYLIAADGAGSPIRKLLGVAFDGEGALGTFVNIHFRADLGRQLAGRSFVMAYTFRPLRTGLMPLDNGGEWLLHVMADPARDPVESFTDERCAELVRMVAGVPGLPVEVCGVRPWTSAAAVASRFRAGRVLLAGDAAHVMPPSGAFGSNLGIQDVHNLAWKLAAVLDGSAGPGLLDTYDAERRPLAEATVHQAVLRSRDRPRLADEQPAPPDPEITDDRMVWFGGRQRSAAVAGAVPSAGEPGGWPGSLDGSPGTRAPHVRLLRGGRALSTLDLFGAGFVLLTGRAAAAWRNAAAAAPAPVACEAIGPTGLREDGDCWEQRYGVGPTGAVLVRPDGVVAWRCTALPDDPAGELAGALSGVLGLPGDSPHPL